LPTPLASQIETSLATGGDTGALAFEGRWRSWRWLGALVADVNAAMGEVPEAGLIARNRPQHIAAFAAAILAGRTTCMIHSAQSASGIAADILRLRLPTIAADVEDWTPELLDAARSVGTAAIGLSDWETGDGVRILSAGRSDHRADSLSSTAFALLTSGTTGPPKHFPLSWYAVEQAVAGAQAAYAGTSVTDAPQIMVHPLGSVAGVAYAAPALAYGQPMVLLEKFDPLSWSDAVRTYRPSRGTLPPAGVRMILDAGIPKTDLSSLSLIAVGGGKLDRELHDAFEAQYDIPILTAFGATEFGGVIANWSLDSYRQWGPSKRGSAGRASAGIGLRVIDSISFDPLPPGEVGLLEAHVPRIGPDWIRSTDLVAIDEDGFLFHHGRADGAINRGGFKIVPESVADRIREHPDVADAAVVGMPDERLGEIPVAAVELVPGHILAEADLLAWMKQRLLAYQMPVAVKIVAALPRNASMKISQPSIKALFG
jgi:long-chain acyl-CoA synthetase